MVTIILSFSTSHHRESLLPTDACNEHGIPTEFIEIIGRLPNLKGVKTTDELSDALAELEGFLSNRPPILTGPVVDKMRKNGKNYTDFCLNAIKDINHLLNFIL